MKLAQGVGVDHEDLSYLVAGINHQAWVLKRSEEHTSELQSLVNFVCRLLP